ncbi:OLC1v1032751C1 [Oldenlandia corymbosa var. corymbosa]|uniref:CASP-like protein n=1 Tax=Oldenlandia corymbosa var. corymbosa TaxID=529605 RepID=A0AAV1CNJ8_OLDCO|nr:OLC1v1032751C1 [Oldenlandia corymbosa var. corymbosa]
MDATTTKAVKLEAAESSYRAKGSTRGISIFDLVLRIVAIVGTLGAAVAMGTTQQTLPFFSQFVQFQAQYNDIDTFTMFVIVNSIVCGYLALSLPLSIYHIVRSRAGKSRVLLLLLDTIILCLLTAGASAAAAIVYLAHNGNSSANWFAICQNFQDFCQRSSGAVIGSFVAVAAISLLIILSGFALSRR